MRPVRNCILKAIVCIAFAFVLGPVLMKSAAYADWNEEGSLEVQQEMWDYLMDRFDNPIAAAAIMGNAGVESNYCPWRYCGDIDQKGDYIESKNYVDKCTKDEFIYDWLYIYVQGFGLFQFSTNYHMQNLWELAEEKNVPPYDVELQLEYLLDRVEKYKPEAYEYLFTCTDLSDATEVFRAFGVGSTFSEKSVMHRISRAEDAYELFTGEEYEGKIYMPYWIGGSLHSLKK